MGVIGQKIWFVCFFGCVRKAEGVCRADAHLAEFLTQPWVLEHSHPVSSENLCNMNQQI